MREIHKAYELIGKTGLGDIHSVGYILKHRKSGAHLALIENDDDNKVFYIGFRTPPEDSTGVAHITEHSVLCGSAKYPLKDPFVELVKGSLNTFLNAITYPDKTVYPVASTNNKDFANLMDVYLDAVFHPNIYTREEIFRQEGWHYEMSDLRGDVTINGVVYNEMKGAFSNPDEVASREILNSLFPDTAYGVESGGDPKNIPDLTYEDFLDFHRRYYHPCNSYIYLYGDMDMNEKLDYLDREYLSKYEAIDLDSEIAFQQPFDSPHTIQKSYPIAADDDTAGKTFLSCNYVVGTTLDKETYQAFDVLDYALLSAPGAPLRQALLDEQIGVDVSGGYDSGLMQPYFSVVVKGSDPEKKDRFLEIVDSVLKEQVEKGLDKRTLLAAINATEFRFREADFGSYPKGLIYGLNMLEAWLYDKKSPFLHMQVLEDLDELKKKVSTGFFEDLISRYLISNTHKSVVVLTPEPGLAAKQDQWVAEKMKAFKSTLSDQEKKDIIDFAKHLKEYQSEPNTPEELATLPILTRDDLGREPRPIHYVEHDLGGIRALHHNIETNGIQYLEMLFDATDCDSRETSILAFTTKLLGLIDTREYSYLDFSNEMNLNTGGIFSDLYCPVKADGSYRMYLTVHAKFLYSRMMDAVRLIRQMLLESNFTDTKRIREVLLEEKSHMQRRIMSSGNQFAAIRASASFLEGGVIHDSISGIAYYQYLSDFAENFDERIGEFLSESERILRRTLVADRLIMSSAGDDDSFARMSSDIGNFAKLLYPGQPSGERPAIRVSGNNDGLATASAVNYVCRAGDFRLAGFDYTGVLHILKIILGYDYLWTNVRVKGGAYGCGGTFQRNGFCYMSSYRDPKLRETDQVFEKTVDYIRAFDCDERDMTKYIIGTISGLDTPLTPAMDASRSLSAYLTGLQYETLVKERKQIIEAMPEDIRALAPMIEAIIDQKHRAVVGNEDAIKKDADLFDEIIQIG